MDTHFNRHEIDSIARFVCGQKIKIPLRLRKIGLQSFFLVFPILRSAGLKTDLSLLSKKNKLNKEGLELLLGRGSLRLLIKRITKIAASSL